MLNLKFVVKFALFSVIHSRQVNLQINIIAFRVFSNHSGSPFGIVHFILLNLNDNLLAVIEILDLIFRFDFRLHNCLYSIHLERLFRLFLSNYFNFQETGTEITLRFSIHWSLFRLFFFSDKSYLNFICDNLTLMKFEQLWIYHLDIMESCFLERQTEFQLAFCHQLFQQELWINVYAHVFLHKIRVFVKIQSFTLSDSLLNIFHHLIY